MASVIWVHRIFKGESATAAQEVQYYDVLYDDAATATCTAARTAEDPTTHIKAPVDGTLLSGTQLVSTSEAKRDDRKPQLFHVTVTFAPPDINNKDKPTEGASVWAVDISRSTEGVVENVYFEPGTENPIENSALEPLPEGLPKKFSIAVYTISYRTKTCPDSKIDGCLDKCNNAAVTTNIKGLNKTFPTGTLLLDDGTWSTTYDRHNASATTYQTSLTFKYKSTGWARKILDQGFHDIDGNRDKEKGSNGSDQDKVTPSYLDLVGGFSDTAEFLTFTVEEQVDFTSLLEGL